MADNETVALRAAVIAGKRYDDYCAVIWRELPIGRIMQALRAGLAINGLPQE